MLNEKFHNALKKINLYQIQKKKLTILNFFIENAVKEGFILI